MIHKRFILYYSNNDIQLIKQLESYKSRVHFELVDEKWVRSFEINYPWLAHVPILVVINPFVLRTSTMVVEKEKFLVCKLSNREILRLVQSNDGIIVLN